jgi:hypothetical protein
MSQPVTPYQPCTISPATEIIVSGERCLHPALSARKWLRTGHYIYDTRGVPLTVVDWYENVPVVLAYVRDADLASIPRFDHHFNIGDWKHVYRPQIRQVDYWANQFPGTTLHLWHGHRHQRETHGRIAIENRPPQTLTVAEQAALQYIQHGKYSFKSKILPPRLTLY